MVARADVPLVSLSWDDRQPLLALDVRRFKLGETSRGVIAREQAARTVRYVGYPAPSTNGAVEYWAGDGAGRFMAEIEAGLAALLPVAWDDDLDVPAVGRKERVTLRVGDQEVEFPGRLWKRDDDLAYLFNSDDGITLVRTRPVAVTAGAAADASAP